MKHSQLSGYLCLTDLLDQDLSTKEYFQTLHTDVREELKREDSITTFDELQARAAHLQQAGPIG